jgi:DNA-binding transcriptional regulator YiaG
MAVKTGRKIKQAADKRVSTTGKPASIAKAEPQSKQSHENPSAFVLSTRKSLGVTQSVFGRLIGVSERSISGWEMGKPIAQASLRRVKELRRLGDALEISMKKRYIPTWLVTPNEGLGGISPLEALDRGENDRLWRTVFYLGSGAPI